MSIWRIETKLILCHIYLNRKKTTWRIIRTGINLHQSQPQPYCSEPILLIARCLSTKLFKTETTQHWRQTFWLWIYIMGGLCRVYKFCNSLTSTHLWCQISTKSIFHTKDETLQQNLTYLQTKIGRGPKGKFKKKSSSKNPSFFGYKLWVLFFFESESHRGQLPWTFGVSLGNDGFFERLLTSRSFVPHVYVCIYIHFNL